MAFESFPTYRLPAPLAKAVNKFLQIDELEGLYSRSRGDGFVHSLLDDLEVELHVSPADLKKIPTTGAVVAVANHPFGILDGVMLAELLTRVRPDVQILTNQLLGDLPELARLCIFIDPFDNPEARTANGRALKQAVRHLRSGGLLLIFPAGEVSHFDLKKRAIRDPEWNQTAARLVRMTHARALPVLICGANGIPFQMLGMVHPRLRTAALPAEMLNKRGKRVEIRIGGAIDAARIESIPNDAEAIVYLRLRTELLARRADLQPVPDDPIPPAPEPEPVADEVPADVLATEVAALPSDSLMEQARDMDVYMARAPQIPSVLREIGRLREVTFRAAGEGTGKPLDLDRHDPHYLHLFIWNRDKREVVGAYRLGDVPALLSQFGSKGLYTESVFRFSPGFLNRLGPAFELGRSFVREEYQKQFAPLLLLWKGIGGWVARHPEYSTLIGAVSVSNQYSPASRELIARYFEKRNPSGKWWKDVSPRRPLKGKLVSKWELSALCSLLPDVEDLSAPIADLERDGKGIPILVRQYVKLGGKLLAFSVDPEFGNTLDGFVMLDLTQTNPETLARYMGKQQAARFFAWHDAARGRVA